MAIAIASVITFRFSIIWILRGLIAIVAPLIAGIIAGYVYTNTTGDGAINGGIEAGIGGLIYTILAYLAFISFINDDYTKRS